MIAYSRNANSCYVFSELPLVRLFAPKFVALLLEFRRTLKIIARILREVVNRVKLGDHYTRRRSRGEVQSRVVVRRRGTKQNMDT